MPCGDFSTHTFEFDYFHSVTSLIFSDKLETFRLELWDDFRVNFISMSVSL